MLTCPYCGAQVFIIYENPKYILVSCRNANCTAYGIVTVVTKHSQSKKRKV